nr:PTS system ascorbate-specific transporter subunit IIC [Candidatus Pantoea persica]
MSDVISGTLKTIMGFVILIAGANIIAAILTIFSQLFEHSFAIQGVVPNTDAMAALAGKAVGKGSPSVEELKVPKSLNFLRDSSVAISLTMIILFIALVLMAGKTFTETQISGGQNFLVFAILQAGVYIILAGVRIAIAEIVPAFKGIADKLVPNARPALDCPTVFPFAPNAVIIGFLSSFAAGLLSMFLCPLFGLSVIVPGLVPHFFCGATAGVYVNITGGRRGAVLRLQHLR